MEPSLITIPLREYQQLVASVQEISKLRSELDYLQEKFAIDVAEDRQRITALEYQEPEPRNLDRGQVLKSLIITNSGKIARKEARKLMRLSESQFSQLLTASKDFIEISPSRIDHRIKILSLK
jgi:DNA-binding transcriptional regulator YiaG